MSSGNRVVFKYGCGIKGKGLSKTGRRLLKQPRGLNVAADGALLVSDWSNHCVYRFAEGDARGSIVAGEEGIVLRTLDPLKDMDHVGPVEGEGFRVKRPCDTCEVEGQILVLDTESCRVQRFSGKGGAQTIMPPPNAPPQRSLHPPESVKYPRAMIAEADGSMVICDTWSQRILRYPPVATPLDGATDGSGTKPEVIAGTPNSTGTKPECLAFPSGIAFDAEGALYVADTNNHRVLKFIPPLQAGAAGVVVAGNPKCEPGDELGELNMPTGLCVDQRDGSFFVADRMNSRVLRFASGSFAGAQGEIIANSSALARPWGVCLNSGGNGLYVSDERQAVVLCIDLDGTLSTEAVWQSDPAIEELELDTADAAQSSPSADAAESLAVPVPPAPAPIAPGAPPEEPPKLTTITGGVAELD